MELTRTCSMDLLCSSAFSLFSFFFMIYKECIALALLYMQMQLLCII